MATDFVVGANGGLRGIMGKTLDISRFVFIF